MYVLDGHPGVVTHLAMSPQCRHIAAAVRKGPREPGGEFSRPYELWLWDVAERRRQMIFAHPTGNPFSKLLFTGSGEILVVAARRAIFLWDVVSQRDAGTLDLLDARRVLDVVHDVSRDVILAAYTFPSPTREQVEVWEWDPGRRRSRQLEVTTGVRNAWDAALFATTPPRLAVCQEQLDVLFVRPVTSDSPMIPAVRCLDRSSSCKPLTFTPDGEMISLCGGHEVALVGVRARAVSRELRVATRTLSLSFAPDSRSIATGSEDGIVTLWEVATGREIVKFDWQLGPVHSLAFAPDGMTLAAGYDGKIVVWDIEPG